jgi:hypothetical protein
MGVARVIGVPTDDEVSLARVQPYQAVKSYRCPGCEGDIRPGTGHVVAVPHADPDDRRHWHHGCWEHRARRRPGRAGRPR